MKLSPKFVYSLCLICACGLGMTSSAVAGDPEVELVEISGAQAMLDRGLPADHPPFMAIREPAGIQSTDEEPQIFGTEDFGYISVTGTAFNPANDTAEFYATSYSSLTCRNGSPFEYFDAQVEPPAGSRINGIRFWTNDEHASENMHAFLWERCQPAFGPGVPTITELINEDISSGSSGQNSEFASFPYRTADTIGCVYLIRVRFGLANGCDGEDLYLLRARLQYRRQVSPAPATATFNDVGTGHWAFQHIEALADSGVTSGCGGGSFCPDAKLSRAEMAVFLSKALGLHWSQHSF
jgi:hypothetical protein